MANDGVRVSLGEPPKIVDIHILNEFAKAWKRRKLQPNKLWIEKVWALNILGFLADMNHSKNFL